MLPRWHVLYGALFTLVIFLVSPQTNFFYLLLVFLSSVFIDLDHYFAAVKKSGHWSLRKAFDYHKAQKIIQDKEYRNKIFRKGDFHLFHTIEFHVFIAILGYFWLPFFYIFIGMVFHSMLDLISLIYSDRLYRREFFIIRRFLDSYKRNI